MNFLLDTNVVSEWTKPKPDPGVAAWLSEVDEDRTFLSVVTIAELRHGVERLPKGARRNKLETWLLDALPLRFEGRILPIDMQTAGAWGKLVARRDAAGRPVGAMDAFIAATADVHGMKIVTRNALDFQSIADEIVNPWTKPQR